MKIRNILGSLILITLITIQCNTKRNTNRLIAQKKMDSISLNTWIGDYATDSLYIDSSEHRATTESIPWYSIDFTQFRISINKDSTIFSLYVTGGNIPQDFKSFSYYCKNSILNDTIFLTTLEDIYNTYTIDKVENFKPIKKPVVKLFKKDHKILATSINYGKRIRNYFLNMDYEDYGDTIEVHRVHYPLEHPKY